MKRSAWPLMRGVKYQRRRDHLAREALGQELPWLRDTARPGCIPGRHRPYRRARQASRPALDPARLVHHVPRLIRRGPPPQDLDPDRCCRHIHPKACGIHHADRLLSSAARQLRIATREIGNQESVTSYGLGIGLWHDGEVVVKTRRSRLTSPKRTASRGLR